MPVLWNYAWKLTYLLLLTSTVSYCAERFTGLELDALHSSIEALDARLRRYTQSSQGTVLNSARQTPGRRKDHASHAQIMHLKSAIARLSLVNSENTKKVKLVESALRTKECSN